MRVRSLYIVFFLFCICDDVGADNTRKNTCNRPLANESFEFLNSLNSIDKKWVENLFSRFEYFSPCFILQYEVGVKFSNTLLSLLVQDWASFEVVANKLRKNRLARDLVQFHTSRAFINRYTQREINARALEHCPSGLKDECAVVSGFQQINLLSLPVQTHQLNFESNQIQKWDVCKNSSECILADDPCGGPKAIHERYRNDNASYVAGLRRIISCSQFVKSEVPSGVKSICKNGRCELSFPLKKSR